jgi:hypothetical protein
VAASRFRGIHLAGVCRLARICDPSLDAGDTLGQTFMDAKPLAREKMIERQPRSFSMDHSMASNGCLVPRSNPKNGASSK